MALVLWDIDQTLLDAGAFDREVWFTLCGELLGVPPRPVHVVPGRTIRQILRAILREYGADAATAERLLPEALRLEVERVAAERSRLASRGRLLPGVRAVVAALDRTPGVVQSVLTGNQAATTRLKLAAFGLAPPLDLRVAATGTDDEHRPSLVPAARSRAEARYGPGTATPTVLVGDSVLDIEAARANDARVVAVATGITSRADLTAAGPDAVLDDLADLRASLTAILPSPVPGHGAAAP
ncbi:HAD family hydrolase [Actinoallomurus iriomotensis]|uniref:Haloacid dehalogenase n=1 Tax=Actinoallomurus iriomotensis TaxID=478107 RepID=A0A9W6REB3_9ACTN|nr:haloacid dehalogenase-like hydrolase [Actinoallomurus iriomotensis]GLY72527.1 haloacid dehalogenase [Actinoallomurus iriomotensis]